MDREDIAAHYDIGTDFFSLFLDETLTYSAAVFPSEESSLEVASAHKFDRLLDKLGRLGEVADLGFDERFRRLWSFYLVYCEAAFAERHCTVNQLVLVGPDWRPDGLRLRPH